MHYRWSFGDGSPVDTAQYPRAHSYQAAGHYTISLVVSSHACRDSAATAIIVKDQLVLGIGNLAKDQGISVFPNPGHGLFHVVVPVREDAAASFDMYAASGEHVYHRAGLYGNTELNLEELASGIYFYKVLLPGKPVLTGKLVIE